MSAEDDEDEQEPTRASPTALAETGVVEITPAAWSDSDEIDDIDPYEDPVRRNWLISGAIFAATAAVAGLAAGGAFVFLRQERGKTSVTTSTVLIASPPAPTSAVVLPPPPTQSRPPTPIELSATGDSVYVSTKSGKTACQVTVNTVSCIVRFVGRTPIRYGVPTNVVMITSGGIMDWTVGDGGQLQTHTLNYGTLYHALGWTITPTSEGTTFTNDATGRGMSVNVDGARAF